MTKQDFTSINVIIDRSGSMADLAADTVGSFNKFLADQKAVPGAAAFSLCTFNHDYSLVHDFVKLASVPDLDSKSYAPAGNTALLDAMGTTIDALGQKLAAMPEDERPSKVVFLIITDGEENSSRRYTKAQIKSKVEHQRSAYNWEFVFMGANIDAIAEGQALGVSMQNSMNYEATKGGTKRLYQATSDSLRSYRVSKSPTGSFFGTDAATPAPAVPVTPTVPTKK